MSTQTKATSSIKRSSLIGLDPSFKTMGLAYWNPSSKALHLYNGTIDQVFLFLQDKYDPRELVAVLEDPNLNSPTYGAWEDMSDLILKWKRATKGKATAWNQLESHFKRSMKISQSVGSNKAAAERSKAMLRGLQIPFITVAPSDRRRVDNLRGIKAELPIQAFTMPTKTSKGQFAKLTGYMGASNEHSRDAATLVYDRNINWAQVVYAKQNGGNFFI